MSCGRHRAQSATITLIVALLAYCATKVIGGVTGPDAVKWRRQDQRWSAALNLPNPQRSRDKAEQEEDKREQPKQRQTSALLFFPSMFLVERDYPQNYCLQLQNTSAGIQNIVGARGDFCLWLNLVATCRPASRRSLDPVLDTACHGHRIWPGRCARPPYTVLSYSSINVWLDFHVCAAPGLECAFTDTTCVGPIVALCQLNLVHLDFHLATDELLYSIASQVDTLPRLRFLRCERSCLIVHRRGRCSNTALPSARDTLLSISLFCDGALVPTQKAPFRLRCLCIEAGDVDGRAFAWLCGSSVGSLQHLKLKGGCSENLRDIAWTETDIAKAALAVLPRLTVLFHAKLCATHLIGFTPNLTHLSTNLDSLPFLDVLPASLTSVHLDAWHRKREFLPEGHLQHPDQVVTVSASKFALCEASSDETTQACERVGLRFNQ